MKKLLIAALFAPLAALAQTYPSPTFNSITLQNPLAVSSGGSGASSSTGTGSLVLSNSPTLVTPTLGTPSAVTLTNGTGLPISTGVSGLGTGVAAALGTGATGSGSVVLSSAPSIANPTVTGTFNATGLVTTADLATQAANTILANGTGSVASPTALAVPSCSATGSALTWTSGTGFGCATGYAPLASPAFTGTPTAPTATSGTNTTQVATTAFVTTAISNSAGIPTVATNSALTALSTASTSQVWRLGFNASGDAPALLYTASGSACSLNAGAGDNGSQVQSSNSKCWIANFPSGPVDVREWGADSTGANDSTTAMQSAHNTGNVVYYHGTFKFSTISMSAGGIVGDGEAYTYLNSTDTTTANDITFSGVNIQPGTNAPVFKNFTLQGQSSKSSGAGIFVTAPSSENQGAQFTNVTIYTFPTNLLFGAASNWAIQNCRFVNYKLSGVTVNNTNNPDSGDSVIMGSLFNTSVGVSPVGINYQASGGLKVIGNKFNGGSYGFFLGLTASANTSDFLFTGNSVENQTVAAIELSRQSGTATFSNIVIVGNQLAINPNGIASDASGAFNNVVIDGNSIELSSTTTGAGISLSSVSTFYVGSNEIQGNGGTPVGIVISSGSSNGKIGKNAYKNLTTTLSNSSSTTFFDRDKEVLSVSVSTSAAYGSLFVGAAAQTFSTPFTVAPTVVCTPTSTATGAVSAMPFSVTATGFTLNVIGLNNSSSIPVTCQADGVI